MINETVETFKPDFDAVIAAGERLSAKDVRRLTLTLYNKLRMVQAKERSDFEAFSALENENAALLPQPNPVPEIPADEKETQEPETPAAL